MKLQLPMFATYLEHSRRGNMAAQRTGSVRVTTALTDTCWSDYGSTSYQFVDLCCEMSLVHVSFVPIKIAKGSEPYMMIVGILLTHIPPL